MSILGKNPMDPNQQGPMGRQIQGGPTVDMGSPTTDLAMQAAPGVATAAMGSLPTAAIPAVAATATQAAVPAVASTAGSGLLGAIGSGLGMAGAGTAGAAGTAAIAPMLAAAGPFALMALPFLLNDGTNKVPEQDFGPDPLAQGYNNGTSCVGNCNCDSCKRKKYNNGTNMAYAGGTDSVPAMLTPGEAVIPAAAAQNPNNKPMIDSMINEGRSANAMVTGEPMPQPDTSTPAMAGPLSGKSQREQMKLMQDMSFKKKAFEAEEMRKQMAFEQKMSQGNMKAMLAMRQSQE
jgi:hypothetical protein